MEIPVGEIPEYQLPILVISVNRNKLLVTVATELNLKKRMAFEIWRHYLVLFYVELDKAGDNPAFIHL